MYYQLSKKYPKKRAFITGAASGLGFALCEELAKDGWTIGMSDINLAALEIAAEKIKRQGASTLTYTFDVSNRVKYKEVCEHFLQEVGGIDLLVNNAGVGDAGYTEEYSLENWEWLLGINLMGVVNGCHYFISTFKKQRSGHIINIASAAAFSSLPRMAAYNVSKAGVLSFSEGLDAEAYPYDVRVSVVMPTFFKTQVMQYSRGDIESVELSRLLFATTELTPEKVAQTVLKRSGKNKFHIILPANAKFIYWLKRYFPKLTLMMYRLGEKNTAKLQQRLQKKYDNMDKKGKIDHDYLNKAFKEKKTSEVSE